TTNTTHYRAEDKSKTYQHQTYTKILQLSFFLTMIPPPPRSTLFPYTTLFRSGSFDATLRTPKLDVPGHLVALRPFLQLLDREQRVGVGHQRVILRIDLAELARLRLVLAEVETRLAEEELVVSIAERPVDCVHVVGLAPRRPAAGIAHGLRRDVARGRIGYLAAAAVRQRLRVVMQRGRPRGA